MAADEAKPVSEPEPEALRLKILAEQKYNSGNLKSALKYANRAYRLHSTTDGVSEMLTAFKILHTATADGGATTATSPLPDYYRILQIERFSHINTIKKQYKKLALTLHPDKNTFVASEEAFKLVGEAFRVLNDKIRRKEYDVKLRIAMQSAVLAEESETTTFWTACSTCRLLHQFERKYLGHNLMCPSCKESFEAIEVSENGENDGGVDDGVRVTARIQARRSGELGVKRKMTKSLDEIGVGSKGVRSKRAMKVRNVESDDELIEGLRSRTKGKVRNVGEKEEETMTLAEMQMLMKKKVNKDKVEVKEKGEEEEGSDKALKFNITEKESEEGKESNLGLIEEEDEAEMEALIARVREKRVNKGKVAVKYKGEEKGENEKAMKLNITEEESEKRKETDLSLMEEEDEEEMDTPIARVRVKRLNKEKVVVKEKGEEQVENEKAAKFNLTGKESEKRKETNLSLIEEEDEAEMETLITKVREKRANKEKVVVKEKGEEKEKNEKAMKFSLTGKESEKRKETDLSLMEEEDEAERDMPIATVRAKRVNDEKVAVKEKGEEKEENEKATEFNLAVKESEKRKEMNLSLIGAEDEAEMETLIARVREKRVNKEKGAVKEKWKEKGENDKAMFNLTEKESGKRKEMDLSLIEEEDEAEMETPIARVREKRVNKEKVEVKEKGEERGKNEKAMKFSLTEKKSDKGEESNLSLIVEEEEEDDDDEAEMDTLIARVREKRVRREALKGDGLEKGGRRDLSSKRGGKGSRQGDLEIMAVKSSDHYNFDKDRVERSFKKGQVWAVYDDYGIPRDYALIDDVISVHPFEVRLNRLEFQRNSDEALVHWGKMGFHNACGKFKVSRQAFIKSLEKFSHVVDCERAARELYRIYPSKGSIWALYKENALGAGGRKLCYDIIVSLSSYTDRHGVSIAYLEKVDTFRNIFKRREVGAHAVRLLGKDELTLFSHWIPARKLSDEEGSNITKDCWELDPASLPHGS